MYSYVVVQMAMSHLYVNCMPNYTHDQITILYTCKELVTIVSMYVAIMYVCTCNNITIPNKLKICRNNLAISSIIILYT